MTSSYNPFGATRFSYANGLQISNDVTTPNTKLDISAGSIRDSSDTYQIITTTSTVINAATNGLNGLDTGTLAASKVYAVYMVSDPVTANPTGAMISLTYPPGSTLGPLMPFGYSAYALIGYIATDASVHFLPGLWTNTNTGDRLFMYDAPQATAVTAGASATYANVNLIALVPNVDVNPTWISTAFTPAAASNVLALQPASGTGDAVRITGQVSAVVASSNSLVLAQRITITAVVSPAINYKVSGGTVAVNVAGYQFFI